MSNRRTFSALAIYAAIASAAFLTSHSTSGFVITGLGSILLLDKLLFQLLPWQQKRSWRRELLHRANYFVLGSVAFFCARFGLVPWPEAIFLGAMTSLTFSLVESLAALIPVGGTSRDGKQRRSRKLPWAFQGACVAFFAISFPYWHTLHPMHTVPKRGPDAMGFAYEDTWLKAATEPISPPG